MTTPDPEFRWRAELPWICIAALLGVTVRLLASLHPWMYYSSDTALIGLIARHIHTGERFALLYYGQDYIGTLEAMLAAPLYGLFPGSPRAYATAQALLFGLGVPLFYRLFFAAGGRAGAVAASLVLSAGTTWLVFLTGGELMGYLLPLVLGAGLLLAGRAFAARPGPGLAVLLGLLAGLGLWSNPQFAMFLAPLPLLLWYRGRTCRLVAEGRLRDALGQRFPLAAAAVALALALVAGALWLAWHGPLQLQRGPLKLSLGRPGRYLVRSVALTGAVLVALELLLAADRRRWLTLAACGALGLAAGAAPLVVARAMHEGQYAHQAQTELDPSAAPRKLAALPELVGLLLLDYAEPLGAPRGSAPFHILRGMRAGVAVFFAAGALLALAAHRAALWRMLRCREVELPPLVLLGLLAAVVLGVFCIHPGDPQVRYLLYLWLPAGGLLAWSVGQVARRRLAAAVLLGALLVAYYATGSALLVARHLPAVKNDDDRALLASLEQRGLRGGYAGYWWSYRLALLADERIVVAVFHPRMIGGVDPGVNRMPWYEDRIRQQAEAFALFRDDPPSSPRLEQSMERSFRAAHAGRIIERWEVGPYRVYRFSR